MEPIIQISIDIETIKEALEIAEVAVAAGVDYLEAGTPLILGEGLHAVEALRRRFPDHPIVADLKTMDAGYLEAEMIAKAGATHVVVMAVAHPGTVKGAVRAARDYGIKVMADIMLTEDKVAAAKKMEALGVDYIILHTGFDERHEEPGKSPLTDLPAVSQAVSIPVQAVGGLSIEQAIQAPKMGAPLVVVGAPLVINDKAFHASSSLEQLDKVLRHVVKEVKGL
ncbi:orotidine 5'-phosphate decarboxylase / HUMPS family protein [Moorella sp. Hama-1]|uniref:orotidine 5'-phosphate decarboxylase / HUMPS family protein n=1 Tax=Moorella sp. Hama-1 TaxID=2138101 RepID=UPI000D657B72|nr:orotidine 5'-phosphate decarboxylase / HUMPS family protein [Moorella sp. Hama-1]BCV19945.1 D-arabino 3-hexulose 6-phosphate aldehyde lyase [Moorella sp. Hama-1]